METKKKVMIAVSVLLLGSAAVLLYRTFSPSHDVAPPTIATPTPGTPVASGTPAPSAVGSVGSILPYGRSLNFSAIEQYNSSHKHIDYPQVSPDEVGVNPQELIKF